MQHTFRSIIGLILISFVLTGCTAVDNNGQTGSSTSAAVTAAGGFEITRLEYSGDNTWNYTVRGDVPTPCHNLTVDAVVRESFPEQVTLDVTVEDVTGDVICAQVITTKEVVGTFSASSEATIGIRVVQ